MIVINLLPPEYREERESSHSLLRNKKFLGAGAMFFGALTVIFYIQYQLGLGQLKQLQGEWQFLEKDVQRITKLKQEMEEGSKSEKQFLDRYVTSAFPTTAILSGVSVFLPESIWLLELKIERGPAENTFLIKGLSLPDAKHSSVEDIEKYLHDLRGKFPAKTDLVLTTSRQIKENKELTLFTAVYRWEL